MGKIKSSVAQEAVVFSLRALPWAALAYSLARVLEACGRLPAGWAWLQAWHLPLALEGMLYAEAVFLVYVHWRAAVLARRTHHPPPITREERALILERMLKHTDDMKTTISGWFLDLPWEQLRREDLHRFISWMLYSKDPSDITEGEEAEDVRRAVAAIEAAAGQPLSPRSPGEAPHPVRRHTIDDLRFKHRPIVLYLLSHAIVDLVGGLRLRALGFRPRTALQIRYWHRPGSSKQQPPLVFVHGIGLGLVMYYQLLRAFAAHGDVFLVELPHASLKVCEFVPTAEQAVASMRQMLAAHGHSKAVFTGHSLGTIYVAWMCRFASEAVAASAFIEPICFKLYVRTLTENFLYREYGGLIGFLIRSEFHLNYALRRHFWWKQKILFVEDIRAPARVFLTVQDEVVPTREVAKYIGEHDAAHHVTTELVDDDFHGSWMVKAHLCDHIAGGINRLWLEAGAQASAPASQQPPLQRGGRGLARLREGLSRLTRRMRRRGSSSTNSRGPPQQQQQQAKTAASSAGRPAAAVAAFA